MLRSALSVLLCTVYLMAGSSSVFAATATKPTTTTNNSDTLKISPLRSDITISAGTSAKVQTFVTNLTSTASEIQPIENDFVAGDEKGTPSIILDPNSYAPTHSLKRFMVPLQNVLVPAGQTKEVDVTITVPKTAQAGGYYGAIRFAPASTSGDKSLNLSASVASLILMTVPGPTTEQMQLTNFDIQQDGGTASNFRTPNDISVLVRFKNTGNIQEAPFGQINVLKGKKVVFSSNFNQAQPRDEVLPDSARRWTVPLKNFGKFGKYTISGTFTYGSKNESVQVTKTIWIVPTTYIIAGLIAIAVIILIVVGFWLFLRSYKRRIMRRTGGNRRRY